MLCEYGCGQEAKYQFKNGKWCCSKDFRKCPEIRRKNSENSKGKCGGWNKGLPTPDKVKNKISEKLKGRKVSSETRIKMSKYQKGKVVSEETRKKISTLRKGRFKGSSNPNWKGGYHTNGIPLYNNFKDKLVEEIRRNKNDRKVLEVRCSYNGCKKWFIPRLGDVYHRVECLNDIKGMGEGRLYCSDVCKKKCVVFGINYDPYEKKDKIKFFTDLEYKEFKKYVLERDNYKCQYCGEKAEHVHHERPQKLEPFFSLDPELAWSVCKKCHYKRGHKDECSTGNLANKNCERK